MGKHSKPDLLTVRRNPNSLWEVWFEQRKEGLHDVPQPEVSYRYYTSADRPPDPELLVDPGWYITRVVIKNLEYGLEYEDWADVPT